MDAGQQPARRVLHGVLQVRSHRAVLRADILILLRHQRTCHGLVQLLDLVRQAQAPAVRAAHGFAARKSRHPWRPQTTHSHAHHVARIVQIIGKARLRINQALSL